MMWLTVELRNNAAGYGWPPRLAARDDADDFQAVT